MCTCVFYYGRIMLFQRGIANTRGLGLCLPKTCTESDVQTFLRVGKYLSHDTNWYRYNSTLFWSPLSPAYRIYSHISRPLKISVKMMIFDKCNNAIIIMRV